MSSNPSFVKKLQQQPFEAHQIKMLKEATPDQVMEFLRAWPEMPKTRYEPYPKLVARYYNQLTYEIASTLLEKASAQKVQETDITLFEHVANNPSLSEKISRQLSRDAYGWAQQKAREDNARTRHRGKHLMGALTRGGHSLAPDVRQKLSKTLLELNAPEDYIECLILDTETSPQQLRRCVEALKQKGEARDSYKHWQGLLLHPQADSAIQEQAAQILGEKERFWDVLYRSSFQLSSPIFDLFIRYGTPQELQLYLEKVKVEDAPQKSRKAWQALCQQSPQKALSILVEGARPGEGEHRFSNILEAGDLQPLLEITDDKLRRQALRLLRQFPGHTEPTTTTTVSGR